MTKLDSIEGIGPVYAEKLGGAGIQSTEALLEKGATKKGRSSLAESTGISEQLLLTWINHADLYRIKGIGSEYSELLEASGVDTVMELARRNAGNLYAKMAEVNGEKNLCRQLPSANAVGDWVEQAKKLPRVLEY